MNLTALPALTDNFVRMLDDRHMVAATDPETSAPVVDAFEFHRLVLAGILVNPHDAAAPLARRDGSISAAGRAPLTDHRPRKNESR